IVTLVICSIFSRIHSPLSFLIFPYTTLFRSVIPNKSKVYQSFKYYMHKNNLSSEEILRDLLKFSGYYSKMLNSKSENKIIQNHLTIIVQLKSTVTFPYLLRLFDKYYG